MYNFRYTMHPQGVEMPPLAHQMASLSPGIRGVTAFCDARGIKQCWFAYFPAPFLLPSDYDIPCKLLPTDDTMYEGDILLPPVVHGLLLISFADRNGFEFGRFVTV